MSSFRAAIGAVLGAALLLTEGCGGGQKPPPAAPSASSSSGSGSGEIDPKAPGPGAIRFEDLPVTRLDKSKVPQPNAANPALGAPNAPVTIQLWSDFECPFCAQAQPVMTELLRTYQGKVRLVWHDYPLPFHAHARLAANAGREAYAQGGAASFWKFHDAIYESPDAELDESGLRRIAEKTGLNAARFQDALKTLRHDAEIDQDVHTGDAVGVEGTPAFLVNDYFFVGAVPIEIMRVVVDRALSDAGAML